MHLALSLREAVCMQQRQKEFTSYRDYIGMDITSLVSLPVWIMEPFTILQRLAEIMEYTEHLDTAAVTEDQYDRCALPSRMSEQNFELKVTTQHAVRQDWRDRRVLNASLMRC